MPGRRVNLDIVRDLFVEQEHHALSIGYKHGWLRTAYVICRSVFFARPDAERVGDAISSNQVVAIVVFENELRAISRAPPGIGIDRIIKLNIKSLPVIREQLGLVRTIAELLSFGALVIRAKGFAYLRRSSIPAIGWLLYRALYSILSRRSNTTVITTNMVHPVSIGVHCAAVAAGHPTSFFEHATTPELIMNERGYDSVYVNFEHTRQLLVTKGFSLGKIRVLQDINALRPHTGRVVIRNVAFCINGYDSFQSIVDVSDVLDREDISVTYRVHDADPRVDQIRQLALDRQGEISLARDSGIHEFLQTTDLVVTGNSNVIADALIANKPVLYYWAGPDDMFDYYGFVRYYDLPHAKTKQSFDLLLNELTGRSPTC